MATLTLREQATTTVWRYRIAAVTLLLSVAIMRCIYLAWYCPLDLVPDEAHYWDWSRHLDWSYYSKGPLVAYLIRLSCWLLGDWSEANFGSQMFAVRFPAVVCGGLLVVSLYLLTARVFRKEWLALAVVVLALTMPAVNAGFMIMTIDSPYTCCWGFALVLGHEAIFRKSAWAWPLLGLVIGLGILAKYTMVLWVASLVLFALFSPAYRSLLWSKGLWLALIIGGVCCTPILIWNMQHNWAGLFHVQTLAGVRSEETRIRWLGPLTYVGVQFAVLLGFWFVIWARAMWEKAPWKQTRAEEKYLWWMSATTFLLFWGFSFTTGGGEPNWAITAYLSGMVLTAGWLHGQLERAKPGSQLALRGAIVTGLVGVALTVLVAQPGWTLPTLRTLAGPPTAEQPLPLRQWDPTRRLRGWHALAAEVDRELARLRANGIEPVLSAGGWHVPGELAFYCRDHPTVYSLGLAFDCRHCQYDFWHPNPVQDPGPFLGKTFLFVGELHPSMYDAFEHLETTRTFVYEEQGYPVAIWEITVCRGFKGFPRENWQRNSSY
jgi:4-amino-4-deoxy-L-arabinose transferase-like glycosyltransferase